VRSQSRAIRGSGRGPPLAIKGHRIAISGHQRTLSERAVGIVPAQIGRVGQVGNHERGVERVLDNNLMDLVPPVRNRRLRNMSLYLPKLLLEERGELGRELGAQP